MHVSHHSAGKFALLFFQVIACVVLGAGAWLRMQLSQTEDVIGRLLIIGFVLVGVVLLDNCLKMAGSITKSHVETEGQKPWLHDKLVRVHHVYRRVILVLGLAFCACALVGFVVYLWGRK
jgi:hypothetical protein